MEIPWNILKDTAIHVGHIILIMILGIVAFNASLFLHDTGIKPKTFIGNILTDNAMRMRAISGETDNISISIAKFCNTFPVNEQAACVVKQTEYNYKIHNGTYTPDQFYNKNSSGVCRDIAIYYASIFKNMGWTVYYNLNTPQHVFIEIIKTYNDTDMRCTIDGLDYTCTEYSQ